MQRAIAILWWESAPEKTLAVPAFENEKTQKTGTENELGPNILKSTMCLMYPK